MKKVLLFFSVIFTVSLQAQKPVSEYEIPYTLEDRERLIRLEEKMEAFDQRLLSIENRLGIVEQRFDGVEQRFDSMEERFDRKLDNLRTDIQNFMLWGFGVMFSFMAILMGFILWDRRTVVKPIENKQNQLIESLKEYAKDHPDLKKILDKAAIL